MFVLQFGVELAVALDVLCYMFGFYFLSWDVSLLPLLKNNVLYVAIYCLCDWNVLFYSFSRPTFNGGLPIVARLALVKGAASFLFCFGFFFVFLGTRPSGSVFWWSTLDGQKNIHILHTVPIHFYNHSKAWWALRFSYARPQRLYDWQPFRLSCDTVSFINLPTTGTHISWSSRFKHNARTLVYLTPRSTSVPANLACPIAVDVAFKDIQDSVRLFPQHWTLTAVSGKKHPEENLKLLTL